MKLADTLKVIAPFLAADHKPEAVRVALLAADKKARDEASPEIEKKDPAKVAKDKAARDKAYDAMSKDEKEAYDAMSDEEKCAKDAELCEKGKAMDRDDDPEHTNDEDYTEGADPSTPGGSRAKGKTTVDKAAMDAAIERATAAERARNIACDAVAPVVGRKEFKDSAEAYRAGLKGLGVDAAEVHESALSAMFKLAREKASAAMPAAPITMDSAGAKALEAFIPSYGRLK